MEALLYIAALAILLTGIAHSVLGERYILMRLFRRAELPHLFGGPEFTKLTLRFAWHITTVAWLGFAAVIVLVARSQATPEAVIGAVAWVSAVSAVVAAIGSKLRHLSWIVFLSVAAILWAYLNV